MSEPRPNRPKKPAGRTIILGWPAKLISLNDRSHHQALAKLTKAWRHEAHTRFADLGHVGVRYDRAHVVISYRFPDNRRREVSNLQPTSKAICDGIVDAGVIKDDRDEIVIGPDNRREWPNGPHRVTVTITPLGENHVLT